ncbi:hypothetical protein E4U49_004564 [Claviceps purpurea]|nr:hypothetical protein E4U49_004564 [Claviceps purpurea]
MRLEGDDVVVHKKALQSCLSLCVVTLSQPRHSWRLRVHALWREFSVRALGAVVAGKLTQATEIPRWPEASTGGTAYVLHIDHLDPKDAKRPLLSKTREEDKVGDFGESRGLNSQKRVLSWAWTIRTDCAERKACAKVAGGQLESCVPAIESTLALEGSRTYHWVTCVSGKHHFIDLRSSGFLLPFPHVFEIALTVFVLADGGLDHDQLCRRTPPPPPATRVPPSARTNTVKAISKACGNGHKNPELRTNAIAIELRLMYIATDSQ